MKKLFLLAILGVALWNLSAGSKPEIQGMVLYNGLEILDFYSPAIENNQINEPANREIQVYLPPGYHQSERSYPVVYFLHGYMQGSSMIQMYINYLNGYFEANPQQAFILVGVDGRNQYSGSFYQNSPVTGNWEDHIMDELIPMMDQRYRTIASREARGISGFSMGGYGAWQLAFDHPDIFGHLMSISPGIFDENGLTDALTDGRWDQYFHLAYGSVFSPNPGQEPSHEVPMLDGSPEDQEILNNWNRGFGNVKEKFEAYLDGELQLESIFFLYGDRDGYTWIPRGTEYAGREMDRLGIDYEMINHGGGHTMNQMMVEQYLLPFFTEAFEENSP